MSPPDLSVEHLEELRDAKRLLENVSLAARIADTFGTPIEKVITVLPDGASDIINTATQRSLTAALDFAVSTMGARAGSASNFTHKAMAGLSGAAGGAFGLPALALELPVSTTIMLRSIADIARGEGEDVRHADTKIECLGVFALGGRSDDDDAGESGYLAARVALAGVMRDAAAHVASSGLRGSGAPVVVRFISQIASRFGAQVTQKFMAQALPVIGAAGGAIVNSLFIDHFQDVARGHFTVRRLERVYGSDSVTEAYKAQ